MQWPKGISKTRKVRDCLQGKNMEALDILFADDVVSVEAVAMTGVQQEY
jgi:hypothetical protein